jgi:hypothetical protein
MSLPFEFDPVVQLNLELPVRVEVFIPLGLLPRFDPSIKPISTPGHISDMMSPRNPLKAIKPAVLPIAELVSNILFASTEPIHQPFRIIGHWAGDGTLEAIYFILNHRLGVNNIGLDPEFLRVVAKDIDGKLVLETWVITGERRKHENARCEGTDLGIGGRTSML